MLEGILHQIRARLQAEAFHDCMPVKGHSVRGHMEGIRDFFYLKGPMERGQRNSVPRRRIAKPLPGLEDV